MVSVNQLDQLGLLRWQYWSSDSISSQRLRGGRSSILPDDYILNGWLSGPWERCSWFVGGTSQKDRGRIHNCEPILVNDLRKGGSRTIVRCWVEQTVNSFDSPGLFQMETQNGVVGGVISRTWLCVAGNHVTVWSSLLVKKYGWSL